MHLPADIELPPVLGRLRRARAHPWLMPYNRLIALVLLVNAAVLLARDWEPTAIAYTALVNLTVAVLARQPYVINLLFRAVTAAPVRWPLGARRALARVYQHGGVHVGSALAGTAWAVWFLVRTPVHKAVAGLLAAVLLAMVATALPWVRYRLHDRFERVHRFGGWTALGLLWVQLLIGSGPGWPAYALTLVSTAVVAAPWLRLRRVPVAVESPSTHVALVRFGTAPPFTGSALAVSRAPLLEWHSFAVVFAPDEQDHLLAVSRAGDWTSRFIDDPPDHLWLRGWPTAGMASIELLYERVVFVATGSGIGPALVHLLANRVPSRLVWAARSPRQTFGPELTDRILAAQPDAVVVDTAVEGKPDLLRLAYAAYADFGAEAVIVISNKKLTWQVVHGLERRGVPAHGAIWDS